MHSFLAISFIENITLFFFHHLFFFLIVFPSFSFSLTTCWILIQYNLQSALAYYDVSENKKEHNWTLMMFIIIIIVI